MAEMKTLSGYEVVDAKARQDLAAQNTRIDDIDNNTAKVDSNGKVAKAVNADYAATAFTATNLASTSSINLNTHLSHSMRTSDGNGVSELVVGENAGRNIRLTTSNSSIVMGENDGDTWTSIYPINLRAGGGGISIEPQGIGIDSTDMVWSEEQQADIYVTTSETLTAGDITSFRNKADKTVATTTRDGLMSRTDKAKLDNYIRKGDDNYSVHFGSADGYDDVHIESSGGTWINGYQILTLESGYDIYLTTGDGDGDRQTAFFGAKDVKNWINEVGAKAIANSKADKTHTHTLSDITDYKAATEVLNVTGVNTSQSEVGVGVSPILNRIVSGEVFPLCVRTSISSHEFPTQITYSSTEVVITMPLDIRRGGTTNNPVYSLGQNKYNYELIDGIWYVNRTTTVISKIGEE